MRLDKFARFDVLPALPARRPSTLVNLNSIALSLKKIANAAAAGGPGGGGGPVAPSPAAFKIIACLGQVRDALCDQVRPSMKSVNDQLVKAVASNSAQAAHKLLTARYGALVADFEQQFRPLDAAVQFEQQRRDRWLELAQFEATLAASVK